MFLCIILQHVFLACAILPPVRVHLLFQSPFWRNPCIHAVQLRVPCGGCVRETLQSTGVINWSGCSERLVSYLLGSFSIASSNKSVPLAFLILLQCYVCTHIRHSVSSYLARGFKYYVPSLRPVFPPRVEFHPFSRTLSSTSASLLTFRFCDAGMYHNCCRFI